MTTTDLRDQIAYAIFTVGLDLSDPVQRKWAEESWRKKTDERSHIEDDADAVLAVVRPLIAREKAEAWHEGFERAHVQHAEFDVRLGRRTQAIAEDNPYEKGADRGE